MSNECMSIAPPIQAGVLVENDPVEDLMEKVCENCRFPFLSADEDELEELCNQCGIEKDIRALLGQVKKEDDFVAWDSQFEDSGE